MGRYHLGLPNINQKVGEMSQDKKSKIIEYLKTNSFPDEIWQEFVYSSKSNENYIIWHISNYGRIAKNYKISYGSQHKDGYMFTGNMTPIHRIVAAHFIPKTDEDIKLNRNYIDHIDGNKTNNHYLNLRWCTIAENNNFPIARKNKSVAKRGELNSQYGIEPYSKGKRLYNNGTECHYFDIEQAPKGWKMGRIVK